MLVNPLPHCYLYRYTLTPQLPKSRMPTIHAWQPNESSDLVIRHLLRGDCVALPTEARYAIVRSALQSVAVAQWRSLMAEDHQPGSVISHYANLFDWLPLLKGVQGACIPQDGAWPDHAFGRQWMFVRCFFLYPPKRRSGC